MRPRLPLGIGHIRTTTHDYTRHGTTTLFAALDYPECKVTDLYSSDHSNSEWLDFLKRIDKTTPAGLSMNIHIIANNYAPTNIPTS